MTDIKFSQSDLDRAGKEGESSAANALSKMAKRKVNVETKGVKSVSSKVAQEALDKFKERAVLAYTQALSGISGVSLLSMERQDAINLVDLFNNRPKGTTVVMQELDKSTIRETLNILANSYVTELSKVIDKTILLSVPVMMTRDNIDNVLSKVDIDGSKTAVLFETELQVEEVDFNVQLYFFFVTADVAD